MLSNCVQGVWKIKWMSVFFRTWGAACDLRKLQPSSWNQIRSAREISRLDVTVAPLKSNPLKSVQSLSCFSSSPQDGPALASERPPAAFDRKDWNYVFTKYGTKVHLWKHGWVNGGATVPSEPVRKSVSESLCVLVVYMKIHENTSVCMYVYTYYIDVCMY